MYKNLLIFFLFNSKVFVFAQVKLKMELEFKYRPLICEDSKVIVSITEQPLKNNTLFVFKNNVCIDTVTTNDDGVVTVKYPEGIYYFYELWKVKKATPDGSSADDFFQDCLAKHWEKPNYALQIKGEDIRLDYYEHSAARCPNQLPCLKVRHLPKLFKDDSKSGSSGSIPPKKPTNK